MDRRTQDGICAFSVVHQETRWGHALLCNCGYFNSGGIKVHVCTVRSYFWRKQITIMNLLLPPPVKRWGTPLRAVQNNGVIALLRVLPSILCVQSDYRSRQVTNACGIMYANISLFSAHREWHLPKDARAPPRLWPSCGEACPSPGVHRNARHSHRRAITGGTHVMMCIACTIDIGGRKRKSVIDLYHVL